MKHLAPCPQIGVERAEPRAILALGRDARVVHQSMQRVAPQKPFDLRDRLYRLVRVTQIDLHMVLRPARPRAFGRERLPRTADHPPALVGESLGRGMANAPAGTGQQQCLLVVIRRFHRLIHLGRSG